MTEQEAYLFDLQGYLVVENALTRDQLEQLNGVLDRRIEAEKSFTGNTHRFGDLLEWGKPYREMIDNPGVLPYLEPLLGKSPRLDHIYLDVIDASGETVEWDLESGSPTLMRRAVAW